MPKVRNRSIRLPHSHILLCVSGDSDDISSAVVQAKRKYLEMLQEKQNLEADRGELQQKYAQKAQQARKLQDMFQMVSSTFLAS